MDIRRLSPIAMFSISVLSVAAFAFPFLQIFLGLDPDAVYNAIAADTFYYLKLADSFVRIGFPSLDETGISNGYMPLWQLTVAALDLLTGDTADRPHLMVLVAFSASFALAAFGIARLSVFVCSLFGVARGLLLLPLLLPGAFFLFFQNVYWDNLDGGQNISLHAWSFANGMESGLCLAIFALIVPRLHAMALASRIEIPDAFILGALSFLALLARLDDVFLGLACGLFIMVRAWQQRSFAVFLAFASIPLLGTAVYLGINYVTAGVPLPSSGTSKLAPFSNGLEAVRNIGFNPVWHVKALPLFGAMLMGLVTWFAFALVPRAPRRLGLFEVLGTYLLLKGAFLFIAVPFHAIGLWYFTNMLTAMNLVFMMVLGQFLTPALSSRRAWLAVPFAALVVFASARNLDYQLGTDRATSYTTVFRDLCRNRDEILAGLLAETGAAMPQDIRIIDTSDAAYAYCLGLPAVGLTGLGDSVEFLRERDKVGFFEAAVERGHDIIGSSDVRYAAYSWRPQAESAGYEPVELFDMGNVRFYRLNEG